jgi:hypothetical protein
VKLVSYFEDWYALEGVPDLAATGQDWQGVANAIRNRRHVVACGGVDVLCRTWEESGGGRDFVLACRSGRRARVELSFSKADELAAHIETELGAQA